MREFIQFTECKMQTADPKLEGEAPLETQDHAIQLWTNQEVFVSLKCQK